MNHLTRACVANLESLYDTMAATDAKESGVAPHYRWLKTPGPSSVWPSRVYGLSAPPVDADTIAREIFEEMKSRRLPLEICVEQMGEKPGWNQPLLDAGLKPRVEFPSMAATIDTLAWDSAATDLDVELSRVTTEDEMEEWAKLIVLGWWKSETCHVKLVVDQYRPFLPQHERLQVWLAHVHGVPAATGVAFVSGDVVGVYMIYVDPGYRNHGLGGFMTAQMAKAGERLGCRTVILQATAEGEPIYRRLGFETVYQQHIYRYPWENEQKHQE